MNIATLVYKRYLASHGIRKRAWSLVRRILVKLLNDPICSLPVHGKYLKLPLSHSLPDYLEQFRYYDRLPRRISEYVHRKTDRLVMMDEDLFQFCKTET